MTDRYFKKREHIEGTPSYVGEASQRHREQPSAEEAEVRVNQRTPERLRGGGGGDADLGLVGEDGGEEQIKGTIQDETRHDAK
jgi:hypothetical protein